MRRDGLNVYYPQRSRRFWACSIIVQSLVASKAHSSKSALPDSPRLSPFVTNTNFVWQICMARQFALANDLFVASLAFRFGPLWCQIWGLLLRGEDLRWEYFMPRYVSWLCEYSNGQAEDMDKDEEESDSDTESEVAGLLPLSSGSLSRI